MSTPHIWVLLGVALLSLAFEKIWIPILKKRGAGQPILEIGPYWHTVKAGTPTMGGVAFILATLLIGGAYIGVLLWRGADGEGLLPLFVLAFAMLCSGIGLFDDYCKLKKRQNEGLTAPQKFLLQLLAAAIFLVLIRGWGDVDTSVFVPFLRKSLDLGSYYYPLAMLFLTGVVNALNLTDGLDGLLGFTVLVMGVFYMAYGNGSRLSVLMFSGSCLAGIALGFLPFNAHPAKVFMGDTGSLFLGALVAGAALAAARPITGLLAGGVYVAEALSVILQVSFFKLSGGRRLFRMAPLHHHFEKCGLGEWSVVALFTTCAIAFAVLAYLGG